MCITFTPAAVEELKSVIAAQSAKRAAEDGQNGASPQDRTFFVRIGVVGGGCSGFTYDMSLTEERTENDEHFVCDGLDVICDPKSHIYLNGTTIDFVDGLMEKGFKFDNPNATTMCGCGSSFGV
jgi:iron-sulfur cluster assembly protein